MDERRKDLITGFDMSFWGKANFTVKREVAAIPAALILVIVAPLFMGILARIILHP